jgi:hypothetical protein
MAAGIGRPVSLPSRWSRHSCGGCSLNNGIFDEKITSVNNELSKKTTYKKNCQKRPPLGGGKSGQLTRGTCRHWQSRHVLAAIARADTLPESDT